MDRELVSPHRLRIFQNGHVWLPAELATEAVEWLEIQAMRSGLAAREQAKIDRLFARRRRKDRKRTRTWPCRRSSRISRV